MTLLKTPPYMSVLTIENHKINSSTIFRLSKLNKAKQCYYFVYNMLVMHDHCFKLISKVVIHFAKLPRRTDFKYRFFLIHYNSKFVM